MSFVSLRFDTAAALAEAWSDALVEAGALAVDLSDPHAGESGEVAMYDEPGAEEASARLWPVSRVAALFAAGADTAAAVDEAAHTLGQPVPLYETLDVPEEDWVRRTQAQFAPIDVGAGLWIVPSWHAPPPGARLALRLDPGLAFGTGSHPTTRLCLQWLADALVPGESVLDYGCGSGILAIAAARLGAAEVLGTDIDPQAILASRANAAANDAHARFVAPDALPAGAFDRVVANILANPLVLLAPLLAARTRAGGQIALSGILAPQAGEVIAAYDPWFTLARWRGEDGWVLLAGTRNGGAAPR